MKFLFLVPMFFILGACSHGNCRAQKAPQTTVTDASTKSAASAEVATMPSSAVDRVKVFKADGSLQCGQGKAIPAAEMQKELKGIKVYSATNQNDGMMRIQLCGSPTGMVNVYEIDRKDLDVALKAGFKEWTND
ncbi:hypothetical protein [Bdellovibrio reynosensis]|uniref:Lipoprotein n=1 Tax=Bdellovibrio reynosensis TaxID=2835041 RepID=A0ABY4CB26_9BACT|nr:hypothetical protein [Bdellovibrio reynosensis]UOF01984.1 hypothetical protein MNR06_03325 [Bdellovibrio reynosensis]